MKKQQNLIENFVALFVILFLYKVNVKNMIKKSTVFFKRTDSRNIHG